LPRQPCPPLLSSGDGFASLQKPYPAPGRAADALLRVPTTQRPAARHPPPAVLHSRNHIPHQDGRRTRTSASLPHKGPPSAACRPPLQKPYPAPGRAADAHKRVPTTQRPAARHPPPAVLRSRNRIPHQDGLRTRTSASLPHKGPPSSACRPPLQKPYPAPGRAADAHKRVPTTKRPAARHPPPAARHPSSSVLRPSSAVCLVLGRLCSVCNLTISPHET
jgi:hypothetical protein